jgi:prepilin-type N-terminal cleavage/methylation domain-containing protein
MTSLRNDERGFTFIEVMLAMVLMLVVSGATMAVFAAMERNNAYNQRFNESQTRVRVATDTLAKRLRNLASPADATSPAADQQPIERANAQDLIFRAVNSSGAATTDNPQNLERYRYCLNTTTKRLYVQRQTWTGVTPATPPATACPGDGWTTTAVLAEDVVNGTGRAVFQYQVSPTPGSYSETTSVSTANHPNTVSIRTFLYVDPDTAHRPKETSLTSRVFLRNQNRPPTALLAVDALANKVTLNASASDDPEGNPLKYTFYDNGAAVTDPATNLPMTTTTNALWILKPASGSHSFTVRVEDVGNLKVTSSPAIDLTCNTTTCWKP